MLKLLVARFSNIAGEDAFIGRWSDDQFVAVLDLPPGSAIPLSSEATRRLSEPYSIPQSGRSQIVVLHATAGVIDRPLGADSTTFRQKLVQLAGAISGA